MIINKGFFHFIIFFVYIRRMQIFRFKKDETGSLGQAVARCLTRVGSAETELLSHARSCSDEKRTGRTYHLHYCYSYYTFSLYSLGNFGKEHFFSYTRIFVLCHLHGRVGRALPLCGWSRGRFWVPPLAPPPPSAIPWVAMIRIKDTPPPYPSCPPFPSSFFSFLLPSSLPLLPLAPSSPTLHITP